MANCNCNDFPISCAPHAPGGDCCHPHGCPPHPCPPPDYKGGTSMYIGARYVPIFADPVEWDDEREYEPLTIVIKDGDCYTSKCYVPKGAQLPPYPENQTKYWVKTSDYNYQFADLKKTVTDLSRLVEQFQKDNEKFTELINGWNETVKEWTAKMDEWSDTMDNFTQTITELTAKLDEEIQRAKDAEQANADAVKQETADREQAISDLDTAYKAADTAIREDFTAADAAEKAAREAADAQLTTDIAAENDRAEGQESAIREEFAAADATEAQARADADTALSNRITSNKTDIDAIKEEQAIQNTNIAANAKNIQNNAAEIAKHADRLTTLESNMSDWDNVFPDTTVAQEVQKEELARANADTALSGRIDAQGSDIEELRDAVNHKVNQSDFTADQTRQDDAIKQETTDRKQAISDLDAAYKAADTAIREDFTAADAAEKAARETADAQLTTDIAAVRDTANGANANLGEWTTAHPEQTVSECATSLENEQEALDSRVEALENGQDNYQPKGDYVQFSTAEKREIYIPDSVSTTVNFTRADMPNISFIGNNNHGSVEQANEYHRFSIESLALKSEVDAISGDIPSLDGYVTKAAADAAYQPKGDYVTTETYDAGQKAQDKVSNDINDKMDELFAQLPQPGNIETKTDANAKFQPKGDYALASDIPTDPVQYVSGKNKTVISAPALQIYYPGSADMLHSTKFIGMGAGTAGYMSVPGAALVHTSELATKADTTTVDAISESVTTLTDTTIPALDERVTALENSSTTTKSYPDIATYLKQAMPIFNAGYVQFSAATIKGNATFEHFLPNDVTIKNLDNVTVSQGTFCLRGTKNSVSTSVLYAQKGGGLSITVGYKSALTAYPAILVATLTEDVTVSSLGTITDVHNCYFGQT